MWQSIQDLDKSVKERFQKIYTEELWEAGLIGQNNEPFTNLKQYMFEKIKSIKKQADDLQNQTEQKLAEMS